MSIPPEAFWPFGNPSDTPVKHVETRTDISQVLRWKLPASRTMTNADTRNFLLDPPIDPGCSRILRDHPSRPNIEEPAWSRELDGQAERLGAPCRRCLAAKCPMDSEAQAPWALKRSLLTASEYSQAFISGVSL